MRTAAFVNAINKLH